MSFELFSFELFSFELFSFELKIFIRSKMAQSHQNSKMVALVSTPWPLYNRPSIQLGALKAYLEVNHPGLRIEARHFYLELAQSLGYKLYHQISERTWLAESIYAALLFPQRFEAVETLFRREARSKPLVQEAGLQQIAERVKERTDAIIDNLKWNDCLLAGFSISLCQLTSSFYFIKRVKQRYPDLIIGIGGSSFSGTVADNFFELFPDIDLVVNGEGEKPLSMLIDSLKASPALEDLPPVSGVITAKSVASGGERIGFNQLGDLNQLPPPNYDDYFALLKSLNSENSFFPVLPLETSRGCWWQKAPRHEGHITGCAFCNLNLQWQGYRHKDPARVVAEMDQLTGRHQTLSVSIVDNVLPRKPSRDVFKKIGTLQKDLHLFAEIRANTPAADLASMRAAGVEELQIGIESVSTSLLKKLKKGTRAIQNLEIMRNCEALGIVNRSNLILHFPGSDERDVAETLQNLDFALPYRPLQTVKFWLGLGSPVWQEPKAYGIRAIYNHPNWSHLFPAGIHKSLKFMILAYRGNLGYQKKIWRPVQEKVELWQKTYDDLQHDTLKAPILSYREGRDFLIITQRRHRADSIKHRLVGTSRKIYLYCAQHRSFKRICRQFPTFAEDKIAGFLKMMVAKKLMFQEKDRYLSLAVPLRRQC